MKEKTTKNIEELGQEIEGLKQEFKGLPKLQRELLLYRKIAEMSKAKDSFKVFNDSYYNQDINLDELSCLIKTANAGFWKPLMLYVVCEEELKYQEIYKESLICYNKVLENYKRLAQELKVNSSLDLSHLMTYMLWNGYFSVNKKHFYELQERLLLPGMHSFDVIKGKGVCLAYAELLDNYLTICGKQSSILNCKVPSREKRISYDYRPKIERNVKKNTSNRFSERFIAFLLGGLINKFGNHAITLIQENGNIYAYDPTNISALNIKDSSTACIINGKGEFKIKPLTSIVMNPYTDSNHICEKILLSDIEPALTKDEFILSFENLMELLNNNTSLLDDAYDNIHSDLEYIDRQTEEIGDGNKVLKK